MFLFLFFAFVFGALIGSFLNVCIIRFGTGKTIMGRSSCMVCAQELRWYELIPIVSFTALRGRCARCRTVISKQYVIVETLTGLMSLFFAYTFFFKSTRGMAFANGYTSSLFAFSFIIWCFLIMIGVYDIHHKAIPNIFAVWFIGVSLVMTVFEAIHRNSWHILGTHILAACILSGFFFLIWALSRGRAMGLGDGILAFGIGLYLGIPEGLSAIAYAFWIGAAYAVIRILIQRMGTKRLSGGDKSITMKSEVPFAPFLILGTFISLALESDVFHIFFFFKG